MTTNESNNKIKLMEWVQLLGYAIIVIIFFLQQKQNSEFNAMRLNSLENGQKEMIKEIGYIREEIIRLKTTVEEEKAHKAERSDD